MLSLKKVYRDELLQLALILSLLRVHPDSYFETDLYNVTDFDLDNGTSWRSFSSGLLRAHYIHPKNLDSVLLNHERQVFAELNSLGRYNRVNSMHHSDITAYLLNVNRTGPNIIEEPLPEITPPPSAPHNEENEANPDHNEENPEQLDLGLELSQEDMELIEVLWKQDVDLGYAPDMSAPSVEKPKQFEEAAEAKPSETATTSVTIPTDDDIEKLKALKDINSDKDNEKFNEKPNNDDDENKDEDSDPWAGLKYTIDTETGEYVIKGDLDNSLSGADSGPSCDLPLGDLALPLPEFLLEEALQLVGLDDDTPQEGVSAKVVENINLSNSSQSSSSQIASGATASSDSGLSGNKDNFSEESLLDSMIQTSQFHHPHHRAFQSRMPFGRTISMEQRWQDLANLLSLPSPSDASSMPHPFSHHHPLHNYSHPHTHGMSYGPETARGVLLHNATLTPPMGDLNGTVPYSNLGGTNLGNAVATSMNLTNSSEPMGEPTSTPHYKIEPSHDMIGYYQNTSSELNQTDGFLSSILNDEDLQLMDMAMNEGMYTMRMLDSGNAISNLSMTAGGANSTTISRADVERMDTSSDSAVSSMGSERVPSLSDGEWCDAGSDSGHNTGDHYVGDYHGSKFRPYDYSYTSRQHSATMSTSDANRLPPVAQKKHQMFGKRCFQEQTGAVAHPQPTPIKYEYRDPSTASTFTGSPQAEGAVSNKIPEMKYSCSVEFGRHNIGRSPIDHIQHNHTYHLPVESTGAMQRPVSRDKIKSRKSESEHLTRDEKRARALSVPITVDDIINLPMDEFNERLSKYDLSEPQLSLIRDIRRRGKNKVAAQNCRKRKLDQILSLADEVRTMRDRKMRLVGEYEYVSSENKRVLDKYQQLYRHVFRNLRDPDGNQYSPFHYSLQITADGSILVVPKANSSISNPEQRKDPPPPAHKE